MQILQLILPEIFLSVSIMIILMLGVYIKNSYRLIYNLTILTLGFTILLILNQPNEVNKVFNGNYVIDTLSIFMKFLTIISAIFILIISGVVLCGYLLLLAFFIAMGERK